jgi:hydrophobic/amphiphilic exporter-1 (mainly G- bacteria), HAE1 family
MEKKEGINTKITKFILNSPRLAVLALVSLIIFGVVSVLTLRTTGFPSPEINIAIVNTVYPGASANTILEQVTRPMETAIKDIEGVKDYSSTSSNNFSLLQITIDESANADSVKSKLDAAVRSVTLPENAQKPVLITPQISSDEYYFALVRNDGKVDPADAYPVAQLLQSELLKNKDVEKINFSNDIEKKISISIDAEKLASSRLSYTDVSNSLRTLNLTLPVAEDANLNDKRYNIILSLPNATLQDIKNIRLFSAQSQIPALPSQIPAAPVMLSSIADVKEVYVQESELNAFLGKTDAEVNVSQALLFSINVSDKADLGKYEEELKKIVSTLFDKNSEEYKSLSDQDKTTLQNYNLVKIFSTHDDNQDQVHEVISGLIGEKWDIGNWGYIGYVFGGIELVFLVMLALVSWRAAIIAALALPLSFFFATIWILLTGNQLNTLVLFSLVLVIGLVVDPALVVLEAIQRNMDNGMKAKEAAIHAIHDIGYALFLAVLTSILVFVPFGVVSGIFGQIISYIPLTIIPALIGSYVVPLVFLTWIGSMFLKKKKNTGTDEEANLWPIAREMHRTNSRILHSSVLTRLIIVLLAIIVPIGIAGYYFGTEKVKSVQFAQPEDAKYLTVSTDNYPQKSFETIENDNKLFVDELIKDENVQVVSPFGGFGGNGTTSTNYLLILKQKGDRVDKKTASEVSKDINEIINNKFKDTFFFAHADVLGAGPGGSSFPMAIAIKTNDLAEQKKIALDLTEILNKLCKNGEKGFEVKSECNDKVIAKIDNGYDSKEVKFIEILLNKEKLATNPVNPIEVRTLLANLYSVNNGDEAGKLVSGTEETPIVLESNAKKPTTVGDIQDFPVRTLDGRQIKLSDIASINEVQSWFNKKIEC